jgi:hypothetical protein
MAELTTEQLIQRLNDQPCNDADNGSNISIIKKLFRRIDGGGGSGAAFFATALLADNLCNAPSTTVNINTFTPWYEPVDLLPIPTTAANQFGFRGNIGDKVLIYWRPDTETWEVIQKIHYAVNVANGLDYNETTHRLVASGVSVDVATECGVFDVEIPLVSVDVVTDVYSTGPCQIRMKRKPAYLFEALGSETDSGVLAFEFHDVLTDIYLSEGYIWGSFISLAVACTAAVEDEQLIPVEYCASTGAS